MSDTSRTKDSTDLAYDRVLVLMLFELIQSLCSAQLPGLHDEALVVDGAPFA